VNRRVVKRTAGAAILILSAIILKFARSQKVQLSALSRADSYILRKRTAEETSGLVLEVNCGSEAEIAINSWEKDGEQWLFLPAMFRGQEIICGDKTLVLEEGEYLLELDDMEKQIVHVMFGSEIPFACIDTESGNLAYLEESKENKESGSMCFVESDDSISYQGTLSKMKIRGNATRLQPKSPFRIGLSSDASLAGLDESEDYVLLAEYGDISLLRNWTAMELAGATTDLYEPEGSHVDLYVNGDYYGVYLLCEGISLGENRLEITDLDEEMKALNDRSLKSYDTFAETEEDETKEKGYDIPVDPADISGGYLLELEYPGRYEGEETTGFRTDRDHAIVVKEPDYASQKQLDYIREQFQQVENAMYAEDWIDPITQKSLSELVDMESLVHKYLIDEICLNTDLWTSQFLYKDCGDDKFHFGPVWDYDMAFGHYDTGYAADESYASEHIWYQAVYENPEFQELLKKEFQEIYLPVLQELINRRIPEIKELLSDSAKMNFTRWSIEEIYERNSILNTGDSFDACVASLEEFLDIRTAYLTSLWLENH
jgi:hypothetical protein